MSRRPEHRYWELTTAAGVRYESWECATSGSMSYEPVIRTPESCSYCGTRHESTGNCINCGAPKR